MSVYASPRCGTCGHRDPHTVAAGQDICTAPEHCDCECYIAAFETGGSVTGVYLIAPPHFTVYLPAEVNAAPLHPRQVERMRSLRQRWKVIVIRPAKEPPP